MIYYIVFIIISFIAIISIYIRKKIFDKSILLLLSIFLIFITGFRFETGYDYFNYSLMYERVINGFPHFVEPLYAILNKLSFSIGVGYEGLLFIIAFLSISIKSNFILQYSLYPLLSFLLYYSRIWIMCDFGQIRQGLALGIILMSYKYLIHRNLLKYSITIATAACIHFASLIFYPLFFITEKKLNRTSILVLLIISMAIASIDLKEIISSTLSSFLPAGVSNKLNFYIATEDFIGLTFSIFLRTSVILTCIFFFWGKIKNNRNSLIVFNIYFWGTIFFFSLNSFPQLGGRGSLYFQQFEIILFPMFVSFLHNKRISQLLLILFLIFYCFWGLRTTINSLDVFIPYKNLFFN